MENINPDELAALHASLRYLCLTERVRVLGFDISYALRRYPDKPLLALSAEKHQILLPVGFWATLEELKEMQRVIDFYEARRERQAWLFFKAEPIYDFAEGYVRIRDRMPVVGYHDTSGYWLHPFFSTDLTWAEKLELQHLLAFHFGTGPVQ